MLNAILQSIEDVIVHMEIMVKWWTPIIEALFNIEDMVHRVKAGGGFDDSAIKLAVRRITRALVSYCDAVSLEDHSSPM